MMNQFFLIFFASLAVSAVLTPCAALFLRKFGFWNAMDGEHKNQVVRGGGIAIALTFILFMAWKEYFATYPQQLSLLHLMPSILILLGTGLLDDRIGLKPHVKLMLQIASCVAFWMGGFRISTFLFWQLPWYLSLLLTVGWGISVLNAFNLIDGLDGLCTGNAMIATVLILLIALMQRDIPLMLTSMVFLGSCAGFLIYNFHPAKLFLGDTGSLFLGLICASLALKASEGVFNVHNAAAFLLVFWLPFCDLGLAVWRRKVKSMLKSSGCEIMERDRFHLHYRLLGVTQNHMLTVLIMWVGMLSFDFFAFLIYIFQTTKITLTVFISISLFSLIVLARYEISYTSCLFRHLGHLERNGNLRLSRHGSNNNKKSFQN